MRFEDLNPYPGSTYYVAPNEEPLVIRELLKHLHIQRAAGICSAGEVGFFSLLPLVRRELILVDHSYRSLGFAMLKYLLLRERGWQDAVQLLTTSARVTELEATLETLKLELPEKVHLAFETVQARRTAFVVSGNYYGVRKRVHPEIMAHWKKPPAKVIRKTGQKLDRVGFVHGDLTDLIERGPFDLLYISNALQHYGRSGNGPLLSQLTKIVKPGGYVVGCGCSRANEEWKKVTSLLHRQWTYDLFQVA